MPHNFTTSRTLAELNAHRSAQRHAGLVKEWNVIRDADTQDGFLMSDDEFDAIELESEMFPEAPLTADDVTRVYDATAELNALLAS